MKRNTKKILFLIVLFLFIIFLSANVRAAEAAIVCNSEVEVNKPITISVKGSGVQWNLKLLVDGKVIATSSELDNYESNKTISFSKEYIPTSAGNKTITLQGSVTEVTDGKTITSFTSKTLKVNEVKAPDPEPTPDQTPDPVPEQKPDPTPTPDPTPNPTPDPVPEQKPVPTPDPEPTKGTVSSCYINGIKVNQYLNVKNKDSVSIKVNTSTKEGLTIYNNKTKKTYTAKSGGTTNVQIVEGEQTLTITLDTGYQTTRRIISTIEGEETPPNVIEEPKQEEKVILKSLVIKGIDKEEIIDFDLTPEFSSEVYEYSLNIPKEQYDITKLDIEAIGDKEEFTVEVTGNEELVDGENIVKIIVKSKDGEKTTEYIIKVNKEEKVIETVTTPVLDVTPNTGVEDNSKQIIKITIVGFTTLIAVAGMVFAVIEYKYKKENEDDEEDNEVGTVPFASVGFKNEFDDNKDILENLREIETTEIEEKTERTSRSKAKRIKIKDEEFEDVEETFETLKEENTSSRKRGKHF